jgi:diguanylate cyclase (GGDEF)-like protein
MISRTGTLRRHLAPLPRLLLLAVLFAITARVALAISDLSTEHIASIWLANGVALGFLLMAPRRHWVSYLAAVLVANMAINWQLRSDWLFCLFLAFANIFEIVAAAYPLRMMIGRRPDLGKLPVFLKFVAIAVVLAPAAAGIYASVIVHAFYGDRPAEVFWTWIAADGLGIGIVTPIVLIALRGDFWKLVEKGQAAKSALLLTAFTATTVIVFSQSSYPLLFVIPPVMMLIAMRLGHAGVAVSVPILTLPAIMYTLLGHGPTALNAATPMAERVTLTQFFVYSSSLLAFWIAGVEAERRRVTKELRISVDKLARLAAVDGLTGLANRRNFDEALRREWSRAARGQYALSLLMIDVDHFKAFNDCYGHQAGDDCLRLIAGLIAGAGKRPADLAARYGGEEFALLLPDTDAEGALKLGNQLRVAIEGLGVPHVGSRRFGIVTASIGIASLVPNTHGGVGPDALVSAADAQLYEAKGAGRNFVMSAQALQRHHQPRLAAVGG